LPTENRQTNLDLARIAEAWPVLSEAIRASIMLLIQAAKGK
jgi:hypothetical protein